MSVESASCFQTLALCSQKSGPYSAMKHSWQFSQWVWNSCTQQKMACSPLYKATFLHSPNATTLRCRMNDTAKLAYTEMRCWMCAKTSVNEKCGNIQCLLQKQRMTRENKLKRVKKYLSWLEHAWGLISQFHNKKLRKGNVLIFLLAKCAAPFLCSLVFIG